MKQYTFTLALAEHQGSIPFYSANEMEDIELEVKYSEWTSGGVRMIQVDAVCMGGINILPVLTAFKAEGYIQRLAEENYEFRLQEQIASNYQNIHRDAIASSEERSGWQRIK